MPPALKEFFRYWSLTFAVLLFYLFAAVVAGMDLWESLMETVRKRRSQLAARPPLLDPNPLKGKTVAETLGMGPGQLPDERRGWVLERARAAAARLGLRVHIVVLEDSMRHFLVHFAHGGQLRTYRVDKTWVADARAGNAQREAQIVDLLERYLASDFLGQHHRRPPRTTELAREAAGKAAPRPASAGQPAPES
ncbi:MAG: hypothetical protein QN173_08515 [Armatimonadota bacterium]|nr:hypothetical protein [Armatimonadota bacterium]MDR7400870.1 hypothetical protein [Armatimonadota bacterium]MDR7437827.1 hypothetical protein [Armatimonadota bacterium]MDR7473152.1 hypothetical protein [Armatimonadota bacterium]MDR7507628.1 hypothetical protein [Armatimonadota bacterium]